MHMIDIYEEHHKINMYSFFISLLTISQIFNSIWMIKKMDDSQAIANSVKII
jgi:hypothetical protein